MFIKYYASWLFCLFQHQQTKYHFLLYVA
nr:unnamed protein product [Callosobruchus analis]